MNITSWLSQNRTIASAGGAFLITTAALVYFAIGAWDDYVAAIADYSRKADQLESLSKQTPPPLESTRIALEDSMKAYESELDGLFSRLAKYRIPSFGNIAKAKPSDQPQEFQDVLRKEVTRIKLIAAESQSRIPPNYYLALESFENKPPSIEELPLLARQLTVLDWISETLLCQRDVILEEFSLSPPLQARKKDLPNVKSLPRENGINQKKPSPIETVAEVRLRFRCTQSVFRKFINTLSGAPSFLVIDSLQVQNSSLEPPRRDAFAASEIPTEGSSMESAKLPVIVGRETLAVSMKIKALEFRDTRSPATSAPVSR
jgi:hypothetical protein